MNLQNKRRKNDICIIHIDSWTFANFILNTYFERNFSQCVCCSNFSMLFNILTGSMVFLYLFVYLQINYFPGRSSLCDAK